MHQFCRVGAYAFIGGYSVITKDALPYGRTVGSRPARVFGLNLIGLKRRGFSDDTLKKLRAAYRYLTAVEAQYHAGDGADRRGPRR